MSNSAMRGLSVFITDLRACRTREQEEKRINKEFAHIRAKFKDGNLNGYDKKKYLCKLLYIYLLGWNMDFGHVEAVNLITSNKYSEKQIGYLGVTLLLTENHELVRLVINSMRKDLADRDEITNCLALQGIANLGGREVAESLAAEVFKCLVSGNSVNFVKKKAALCILRLYRKYPDCVPVSEWAESIIAVLNDYDLGVNTAVMSLIIALVQDHPDQMAPVVPIMINRLSKLVLDKEYIPDNVYYTVPVPWLQVKYLRCLQLLPPPTDSSTLGLLKRCLTAIITQAKEAATNVQQNNAVNAVVFEAIHTLMHVDSESDLAVAATDQLGRYASSRETNMRYLGLETMAALAAYPACFATIKQYQQIVTNLLKDKDISVRRRALDVLYAMCDNSNAKAIVTELLHYLNVAEYAIREEMVLKIAILTEKFATEPTWYVDVILQLISVAGDNVSNEVWHRVVQIVTNNENLHQYAARQIFAQVKTATCHENAVKVGGYILGEFGDLIANEPGCSPTQQFKALHSKFGICTLATRALLLSTYIKFINLFPEIKTEVMSVLHQHRHVLDTEMQQRACEYFALATMASEDLLQSVFEQMPPFPERESALVERLRKKAEESGERSVATSTERRQIRQSDKAVMAKSTQGTATTATSTAPSKQQQQPSATVDLLGLDVGPSAPSSYAPAPATATATVDVSNPQLLAKISAWYLRLLIHPNGILYEDERLQIGLKSEYHQAKGRLTLFLGNKSPQPITNLQFDVGTVPWANVNMTSGATSTVGPMAQVQQAFDVGCTGFAVDGPRLGITFSLGAANIRLPELRLPLAVTKFQEPIAMQGPDFLSRWKQIGGAPKEAQEVFKQSPFPATAAIREVLMVGNFSVLDGVDPNAANFVACSVLNTVSGVKVGCLLRIEINEQQSMCRVSVRTTNEAASSAMAALLKYLITSLTVQ